jgi:molybdopterin-guanine dinucleotide biosynthesis protein
MAIVVVGGHSRNVGKTSVVAGLIAALLAYNWTAFKITQFGHAGHSRGDAPDASAWRITQESNHSGRDDTSRFLAAGAKAAFLVETAEVRLHEAMPAIQSKLAEAENAIIESNSILQFLQPDLYIVVLDPANEDFKASAQQYVDRADAIVLHDSGGHEPHWRNVTAEMVAGCPVFRITPPQYVNQDLVEFVAERLKVIASSRG